MTTTSDSEPSNVLLGIFPLGLALGGVLAATRALLAGYGGAPGADGQGLGYRVLAIAEKWPELLAEALIAGVVCSLVLMFASDSKPRRLGTSSLALLVTFLASGAFLTGYPDPLPGISLGALGAAAGASLLAFGLSRLPFKGVLALVLGLAVGLGLPWASASYIKDHQNSMEIKRVRVDLVAQQMAAQAAQHRGTSGASAPDFLRVVTQRADAPVRADVMTPVVSMHEDTGDKPSLILPAPATVEFTVPEGLGDLRFQAAANLDLSSIDSLPGEVESLPIEYRVRINGEVRWETSFEHKRVDYRTWATAHMAWRHLEEGGERGLSVAAGDTVQLETRFAEGFDGSALTPGQLKMGFGGAALVEYQSKPRRVPTPAAQNVIYVVIDTQRYDRLGCYGYPKNVSPNIDAFAGESTVFEDAYTTSSWTWPSTASLLTSLPPDAHGVKSNSACTLDQSLVTIAEALQGRGYTTAAFVGNPIVSSMRYFDQGFEHFDESQGSTFRMSDELMPAALDWLETHAPLRFFMYLHLVDPHTPHTPSPAQMARLELGPAPASWPEAGLDGIRRPDAAGKGGTEITPELVQYANDLYDTSVATTDMWFGKLLDKVEALGLDDRTIIVLTTDHGEELLDRGFRGHGHTVYPELVRAPLIIHVPGRDPARRAGVVSNRHVPTTIAALCDAPLPGFGGPIDMLNETLPDEALFETTKGEWFPEYHNGQEIFGLRRGSKTTQWRYSDAPVPMVTSTDLRHFDDQDDPTAQVDLMAAREEDARAAAERIREMVGRAREVKPRGVAGIGDAGASTLDGMGYGGDKSQGAKGKNQDDE